VERVLTERREKREERGEREEREEETPRLRSTAIA
jgi:hypothetical protein